MPVACLVVELHIGHSASLKAKRAVVKHLLATARSRYGVAASELGAAELWQRAELGFAAVGSSASQVESVLDTVDRFVWSHPEVEVIGSARHWLELEE